MDFGKKSLYKNLKETDLNLKSDNIFLMKVLKNTRKALIKVGCPVWSVKIGMVEIYQ
jgi:hypothetical protein